MFRKAIKRAARAAGVEIYRAAEPTKWSHIVRDYYPIDPRPRWGHGLPPNPYLMEALEKGRDTYEAAIAELQAHRDVLRGIDGPPRNQMPMPVWDNVFLSPTDSASLVGFLLSRRPKRFIEVGSGNSTLFARYAITAGEMSTTITSIDPMPRKEIDLICDHVIRKPLESCNLDVFDEAEAGDLIFIDSSHRVFTNSDVTVFFLEVLPRLKPGVLVHLHDIYLPYDYPSKWNMRLYSEQYLLGAMLLCREPPFRVLLPNGFASMDGALRNEIRRLFEGIPYFEGRPEDLFSSSFWLETTGNSHSH